MNAQPDQIPAHYFERGDYEVWGKKSQEYTAPLVLIASGLCLETARAFNWRDKEIRQGKQTVN